MHFHVYVIYIYHIEWKFERDLTSEIDPALFRPTSMDTTKQEGGATKYTFRAHPLNKKVMISSLDQIFF